MDVSKKDWALFRERVPKWQERFMDRLLVEYKEIIESEGKPSERYHALDNRIREDRKSVGVWIEMSRSIIVPNMIRLVRENVITREELEGFSEEILRAVDIWLED